MDRAGNDIDIVTLPSGAAARLAPDFFNYNKSGDRRPREKNQMNFYKNIADIIKLINL
jgi:hypothetical protein